MVSNNVPSNLTKGSSSGVCSALIYGNFSDLLIGLFGDSEILVDPYSAFTDRCYISKNLTGYRCKGTSC